MSISLLKVLQIIFALILTFLILPQSKGGSLSSSVGSAFTMYRSKRGAEKFIFVSTIVLSIAIVINSILILLFS
ncbi:preprotein translocase subunit SecG [candidate division WWE3 bacterium RBG_13_37_7]|uniref:Protein-export membrane protein SecG n=1 Tax=candidate division WWE3 bacterium RBG_13_37_7 TaxID=1802609 RepID=A0A1F4U1N7_UNCKA|nr:MAG: preprotein translocase subunit SecG [candidate division WWE3 bacterium RBG_13_37_7]